MGAELVHDFVERGFRIAEKALRGEDLSNLPVYPKGKQYLQELAGHASAVTN